MENGGNGTGNFREKYFSLFLLSALDLPFFICHTTWIYSSFPWHEVMWVEQQMLFILRHPCPAMFVIPEVCQTGSAYSCQTRIISSLGCLWYSVSIYKAKSCHSDKSHEYKHLFCLDKNRKIKKRDRKIMNKPTNLFWWIFLSGNIRMIL